MLDEVVDRRRIDGAQHDMGAAHRGERIDTAPAVAVEHRQRPQLDIVVANAEVDDHVVGVEIAIAVRQHHALGPRGGAGGVVDRDDVVLVERDGLGQLGGPCTNQRIPVDPSRRRIAVAARHDPVPHGGQARADPVDHVGVLAVDQHGGDPGVIEDVLVVAGDQPIVQRHENGADETGPVKTLEEEMRVGTENADAVALADAEAAQGVAEPVRARRHLAIGESLAGVDHAHLLGVSRRRAAQEIGDEKRHVHWSLLLAMHRPR